MRSSSAMAAGTRHPLSTFCARMTFHFACPITVVYVRGHGPTGRYKGRYPEATLSVWARKIRSWRKSGKTVYVFFDNDQKSAAPAMPPGSTPCCRLLREPPRDAVVAGRCFRWADAELSARL